MSGCGSARKEGIIMRLSNCLLISASLVNGGNLVQILQAWRTLSSPLDAEDIVIWRLILTGRAAPVFWCLQTQSWYPPVLMHVECWAIWVPPQLQSWLVLLTLVQTFKHKILGGHISQELGNKVGGNLTRKVHVEQDYRCWRGTDATFEPWSAQLLNRSRPPRLPDPWSFVSLRSTPQNISFWHDVE